MPSARADSNTWISSGNAVWTKAAAWASGTAPSSGDTAFFVTGGGAGNIQISGSLQITNIFVSDPAGPVFYTPAAASINTLTVTGTFSSTATAGSLTVRNNSAGLLNFVGNVVSNSGGGNMEFGFNGASNPLNAYSAASTNVTNSSLTGFNVTGTANLGDVTVGSNSSLLLQDATTAGSTGVATATSLSGTGTIEVTANKVSTNTATLILTNSGTTATFGGQLNDGPVGNKNTLNVTLNGTGTQVLAGNNTYTGATTVSAGSLLVSGGLSGSTSVTVAGGATFGIGEAAGAPSFKTLTVASINTGSGTLGLQSIIKLNLDGGGNDAVVTGDFALNGQPINLILTGAGTLTGSYNLISWTSGGFTDLSSQLNLAGSSSGISLSEFSISENSLVFTVAPEPSSLALLGAGLLAMATIYRRRGKPSRPIVQRRITPGSRHSARGRTAFTLIEMLAATAIIGILATFLLAGVQNMITAGLRAKSMSNLRQTTLGFLAYSSDNNGIFPTALAPPWMYQIYPYVANAPTAMTAANANTLLPHTPFISPGLTPGFIAKNTTYDATKAQNLCYSYNIDLPLYDADQSITVNRGTNYINPKLVTHPSEACLLMTGLSWSTGVGEKVKVAALAYGNQIQVVYVDGHIAAMDPTNVPMLQNHFSGAEANTFWYGFPQR